MVWVVDDWPAMLAVADGRLGGLSLLTHIPAEKTGFDLVAV
jgi:hypothetical protein